MKLLYRDYTDIRRLLSAGDLVAFEGRGFLSGAIRLIAGGPSHVEMVARVVEDGVPRVQLLGSTSMKVGDKRVIGVQKTYLSDRVRSYNGSQGIRSGEIISHPSARDVSHVDQITLAERCRHGRQKERLRGRLLLAVME